MRVSGHMFVESKRSVCISGIGLRGSGIPTFWNSYRNLFRIFSCVTNKASFWVTQTLDNKNHIVTTNTIKNFLGLEACLKNGLMESLLGRF